MATPVSGADSWLLLNNRPLSFQANNENWEAQAREFPRNVLRITSSAPDDLQIWIDNELLETERYGRWYWKPKGYAGIYFLHVSLPGGPMFTASIRVFPEKISYARYAAMLDDIGRIMEDVLFRLQSPSHEKVALQHQKERFSALKDYYQIKLIMAELIDIFTHICRNPHSSLQMRSIQQISHEAHHFSHDTVFDMGAPFHPVMINQKKFYLPTMWTAQQSTITYDTYENRLLKHFILHQLVPKVGIVRNRAIKELELRRRNRAIKIHRNWRDDESTQISLLENIVEDCRQITRQCVSWTNETFLKLVRALVSFEKASQVLQKHPDYNRFYLLYLQYQQTFRMSLNVEHYLMSLALRKLNEIYEIWAIFSLTEIILQQLKADGYRLVSMNVFFQMEKDLFQVEVQKNTTCMIIEKDDIQLHIKYEPKYLNFSRSLPGFVSTAYGEYLLPDMAIEVYYRGVPKKLLIFDPKYRSENVRDVNIFLEEDVNKMRFYRDKLRINPDITMKISSRLPQAVSSAYILYPGDVFDHDSIDPEVGALPLVPNMAVNKRMEIEQALADILRHAGLLSPHSAVH